MGVCPKCGAPVADTDLACRQCGMSFVADPNVIAQNMASSTSPYPPQQPQRFSSQPSGAQQYNPYGPPGTQQPYSFSSSTAGMTSSLASSAMTYAIIGFFCCGPIFGILAIMKAQAARAQIAAQPGMAGLGTANNAYYLGWVDILLWVVVFIFRIFTMNARHR